MELDGALIALDCEMIVSRPCPDGVPIAPLPRSQLPNLSVVTFRRYLAWHDRWKAGVTDMLPRLLLAHKVRVRGPRAMRDPIKRRCWLGSMQ